MARKKHTPGRGHRRKSDPPKKRRFQRRAAKLREEAQRTLKQAWDLWDNLPEEVRRLRPELEPKEPRPTDED